MYAPSLRADTWVRPYRMQLGIREPGEGAAVALKSGEVIALAGMVVLLLNNLGRRRAKQGQRPAVRGLARFLAYGDFIALGIILAGLVVIYLQK
jgi:hypothetical protein